MAQQIIRSRTYVASVLVLVTLASLAIGVRAQAPTLDFGCGPYVRADIDGIGSAFMVRIAPTAAVAGGIVPVYVTGPRGWNNGEAVQLLIPYLGWTYFGQPIPVASGRYVARAEVNGIHLESMCELDPADPLKAPADIRLAMTGNSLEVWWSPVRRAVAYHVWIQDAAGRVLAVGDTRAPPIRFRGLRLEAATYTVHVNAANTGLGPQPPAVPRRFLLSYAFTQFPFPLPDGSLGDETRRYLTSGATAPSPSRITPERLSRALFGRVYPMTQGYLNPWSGNPTPDHRHAGIDYGAPAETEVRAVRDGEVIAAGGRFGTVAVFDGCNTVIYLHLQKIYVSPQEKVTFGKPIGTVGGVGAPSPHLHLEVRRGFRRVAVGRSSGGTTASLTYDPLSYIATSREFGFQPTVSVSPSAGPTGTAFSVLWSGFTPGCTLQSHLRREDGSQFRPLTIRVEHSGTARHTIDSARLPAGRYELWGMDEVTGRFTTRAIFQVREP